MGKKDVTEDPQWQALTREVDMSGDYELTWLDRAQQAMKDWRPFYKTVHRLLQKPRADVGSKEVSNLVSHADVLAHLGATIKFDQEHRVRYYLWRAYIHATQPIDDIDLAIRRVRWFIQRGRRGWSDADTFSIDSHLCRIIPAMIDHMRKNSHTWPGDPMTIEEWDGDGGILDQIATGFRAAQGTLECDPDLKDKRTPEELDALFHKGFELFHKWFYHLWD